MATIHLCDLCGKPLDRSVDRNGEYKIKKRWYGWPMESGWDYIEAHQRCIKRLYEAVKEKRE